MTGRVIGELHRRHRAVEFKKFLDTLDAAAPTDLDVHVVLDNLSTHNHNEAPKPFVWTKTADEILASVTRFCLLTSDSGH